MRTGPAYDLPPTGALIAKADALRREAEAVLADLGLLSFLSKYGRPEIVGSTALGLMTRRDVDIDLEVVGEIRDEQLWGTARYLLSRDEICLLSLADDRRRAPANRLPSLYVGVQYREEPDAAVWKIDIRIVRKRDAIARAHVEKIGVRLTEASRLAILRIKDCVAGDPRYGREFSGIDIYDAVLDHGVVDVEGFRSWLGESRPAI